MEAIVPIASSCILMIKILDLEKQEAKLWLLPPDKNLRVYMERFVLEKPTGQKREKCSCYKKTVSQTSEKHQGQWCPDAWVVLPAI